MPTIGEDGGASILLIHQSFLIPPPLSCCSIDCMHPVRVHMAAFKSGIPFQSPSFTVTLKASEF